VPTSRSVVVLRALGAFKDAISDLPVSHGMCCRNSVLGCYA
jgi:hypothetical protein